MTKIETGSVITGTLRSEDLIPAFTLELERLWVIDPDSDLLVEARAWMESEAKDDYAWLGSKLVAELLEALNEHAPKGFYFGAHEGDGSDFGWWPIPQYDVERPGGCSAARVLWTAKSANRKTGPMPVSTSSDETCPDSCPLLKSGACYAKHDRLGQIWRALSKASPGASWKSGVATLRAIDWQGLCDRVAALVEGTIWRHNQAGDLPHRRGRILKGKLLALVRANRGRRGFTYTHHDVRGAWNRALVRYANARGFTINLSANNMVEADQLADAFAGPVVVVVPDASGAKARATPAGRIVRDCPATYADVTCLKCQWCAMVARDWIVAFPAHGAGASKVRAIDLVPPHLKS